LRRRTRRDRPKRRYAEILLCLTFVDSFSTIEANKRKPTSQIIEGLPEGEQHGPPPPPLPSVVIANDDLDSPATNDERFSLHPDDPRNFLKLCSALRILIRRRLTDSSVNQADCLLREYCTELISVRCS
jgi:hypothetical protein